MSTTKGRTRKRGLLAGEGDRESLTPPPPSAQDLTSRPSIPAAEASGVSLDKARRVRRSKTPPPPGVDAAPEARISEPPKRMRRSKTPPPVGTVDPVPDARLPADLVTASPVVDEARSEQPAAEAAPELAVTADPLPPKAGAVEVEKPEAPEAEAAPAQESKREKAADARGEAKAKAFRDEETSVPPTTGDLDDHFFESHAHKADHVDEDTRDPKVAQKMTAAAIKRRAQLAKWVKLAVAAAAALCLVALVQAAIARSNRQQEIDQHRAAAAAISPPAPTQPAAESKPAETATAPAALPSASAASEGQDEAKPDAAVAEAKPDAAAAEAKTDDAVDAAVAATSEPTERDPKAAAEKHRQAQSFLERGKTTEAIDMAEKALALDPDDAYAWLILGAAHQEKGNLKEARRCYTECTKPSRKGPKGDCAAMLR